MLSYHFYTLDCLAAQLLYSLQIDDASQAYAVANELATSDQNTLLMNVLCLAWWLQSPDHLLQKARASAFLKNDVHDLLSALLHSPFSLPVLNAFVPPCEKEKSVAQIQKDLKKRDWVSALAGAQTLKSPFRVLGLPTEFERAYESALYKPLEHRILAHALGAATAFPSSVPKAPPWKMVPRGSRAGRTFSICDTALTAWQVRRAPVTALRGDPRKLIAQQQQPLFETQGLPTKDHEIAFYKKHFPDDIPDEWSDEEIAKSHGPVVKTTYKNIWRAAFLDCF